MASDFFHESSIYITVNDLDFIIGNVEFEFTENGDILISNLDDVNIFLVDDSIYSHGLLINDSFLLELKNEQNYTLKQLIEKAACEYADSKYSYHP